MLRITEMAPVIGSRWKGAIMRMPLAIGLVALCCFACPLLDPRDAGTGSDAGKGGVADAFVDAEEPDPGSEDATGHDAGDPVDTTGAPDLLGFDLPPPETCHDNVAQPGEVCDGDDLRQATCQELGFAAGLLACASNCLAFDVTACTTPTTACATTTCFYGGSCAETDTGAVCLCRAGYTGAHCETPVEASACDQLQCDNGGLCALFLEPGEIASCDCTPYYSGADCSTRVADPRVDGDAIEFYYRWQADDTEPGQQNLPEAVPAPEIDLDGEVHVLPQSSAALRLLEQFSIALDDDPLAWDDETATALLRTVERFPSMPTVPADSYYRVNRTTGSIADDVELGPAPTQTPWVRTITFSADAFTLANPIEQPPHDGVERQFYSNRLYRACVRAFFHTAPELEVLLLERFGIALDLGEPKEDFQAFTYEEILFILSVLEDYPGGYRHLPNLEYLTRRKTGMVNPYYPQAPAIAWVGLHHIEFMDAAFDTATDDYIHRLIAHELSHFVYDLFDPETLDIWWALSGWHQVGETWIPTTTSNFVTAYAHDIDPNEDFAETLSYYIYDPDWVRTIAPGKYWFLRDIVNGYEYVVMIDEQVTFEVFNLYPDMTFPGQIVRVTNVVTARPGGAHRALMELRLHQPPYDDTIAFSRIFSPSGNIYRDVYFLPVEGDNSRLLAEVIFGPHDEDGYWSAPNITVEERHGSATYFSQSNFGWMLYFDNEEVDFDPPVPDLDNIVGDMVKVGLEYIITIAIPATDAQMNDLEGWTWMAHYDSGQKIGEWGVWSQTEGKMVITVVVRPYHAFGTWTFRTFRLFDVSGNGEIFDLYPDVLEFYTETAFPDYTAPELNLDGVTVEAEPVNPEAPNGQTDVYIHYQARDDIAGLGDVSFRLLKPSGDTLFDYHYHDNFYTDYFEGDPTVYADYTAYIQLPPGSEPGMWGLMELNLCDKADNCESHGFTELGIVVTDG